MQNSAPERPEKSTNLPAWYAGKSIADLGAIEAGNRILIPDRIVRRKPNGEIVEDKLLLRLPHDPDRMRGRIAAMKLIQELAKRKQPFATWQEAQQVFGPSIAENYDSLAILAECWRSTEAPFGQAFLLEIMLADYPMLSLLELYKRLDFYVELFGPQVDSELSEEDFWGIIEAIHQSRNLGPLVAIGGGGLSAFMVRSASELYRSRTTRSSSPSTET